MISDPLKYTSFFFLTLQNLVYFSGPKFGKIKYISFFFSHFGKPNVFQCTQKMEIFVLKDKNFDFMSPLKHIRFFKVREKKLMYFIFPNLGPLKYIRCEKMTLSKSTLVPIVPYPQFVGRHQQTPVDTSRHRQVGISYFPMRQTGEIFSKCLIWDYLKPHKTILIFYQYVTLKYDP